MNAHHLITISHFGGTARRTVVIPCTSGEWLLRHAGRDETIVWSEPIAPWLYERLRERESALHIEPART